MDTHRCHWDLPSDPEFVGKARSLVRDALAEWGLPARDVELVVSELVTNAVVHGRETVQLDLSWAGVHLVGAVTDHGPLMPRLLVAAADALHGRGLAIVATLVDEWGVTPLPDGSGKSVWFRMAAAAA